MEVFLSYNRRDAAHAAALNDWLTGQGVGTFFDQRDLGAGQLWLPDLERRIEQEAQAAALRQSWPRTRCACNRGRRTMLDQPALAGTCEASDHTDHDDGECGIEKDEVIR